MHEVSFTLPTLLIAHPKPNSVRFPPVRHLPRARTSNCCFTSIIPILKATFEYKAYYFLLSFSTTIYACHTHETQHFPSEKQRVCIPSHCFSFENIAHLKHYMHSGSYTHTHTHIVCPNSQRDQRTGDKLSSTSSAPSFSNCRISVFSFNASYWMRDAVLDSLYAFHRSPPARRCLRSFPHAHSSSCTVLDERNFRTLR